jgi:biopolymer transport protein ExbD
MSMSSGGTACAVSEMNVTPLIDVLLILFMVIVPAVPKGLGALIPQTSQAKSDPPTLTDTIVVRV